MVSTGGQPAEERGAGKNGRDMRLTLEQLKQLSRELPEPSRAGLIREVATYGLGTPPMFRDKDALQRASSVIETETVICESVACDTAGGGTHLRWLVNCEVVV